MGPDENTRNKCLMMSGAEYSYIAKIFWLICSRFLASFPGHAQLFVACSTVKRFTVLQATESWAGPGNEASRF